MHAWISYHRPPNRPLTGSDVGAAAGFLLLMVYLFVGVAFASDIFVFAIEKIGGSKKKIKYTTEHDGVIYSYMKTVPVWNETVANLTLHCLGSSAPVILLSIIETVEGLGSQDPGELGPGTIVGAAAFNLMVITAVCITSVGDGRTSRIKQYKVFGFTALTSLFAYIWMVVVLEWHTQDQVDLWEALATLVFFPALVLIAYWTDKDFCLGCPNQKRASTFTDASQDEDEDRNFCFGNDNDNLYDDDGNLNKAALQNTYTQLAQLGDLTPAEIIQIIATKLIRGKHHSRAWYRSQMTRTLMGGSKLMPVLTEKLQEVADAITGSSGEPLPEESRETLLTQVLTRQSLYENKAVVEFQAATIAVEEAIGTATIHILSTGKQDLGFEVNVESYDGSAKSGVHYEAVKTTVKFEPDVKEGEVNVVILNHEEWNLDSDFFLKLVIPSEFEAEASVGQTRVIEIIIRADGKPGNVTFVRRGYIFKPSAILANVDVERHAGADGTISIQWKTIPGPECQIVKEQTGTLEFKHKEVKKCIEVHIDESPDPSMVDGDKEKFDIELSNPTGGAKLGKYPKTTIAVSDKTDYKLEIDEVLHAALQLSAEADEETSYKDQIIQSVKFNTTTATGMEYFLLIITLPYRIIFAFIPPAHVLGGWATFLLALGSIGLLMKVVGETASAFGNAVGMDPVITAITLVALGTSLPDTFASKYLAMNDKTADNAIGNVTGSNCVNVFLGLGIPWTVGAIFYDYLYHETAEPYCVPAGSLTFNVMVYTICTVISLLILTVRRYSSACGKAELGGPCKLKWATAISIFSLWLVYIFVSSIQVILHDHGNGFDISHPFEGRNHGNCTEIVEAAKHGRSYEL